MARGKPIGSFYVQLGLNTQEFQKNIKGAERDLRQAFGSAAIRTSQMLAASMTVLAGAMTAVGFAAVKLSADLERQQVSFTRLLGSAEAANQRLRDLQEFASKTPFTFTELIEYEKRLLALGFAATETRSIMTTLGDAASGLGMGSDGVQRLIKAFSDIRAKGYLQTQEVRQLAEAGIPAFEILAQKLGKTIPEAMQLIEGRAVDAVTAIAALTEGINDRFSGMMALQSETMLGMWSTVRDEGENVLRILGKQIIESAQLNEAMRALRSAAQEFRAAIEDQGFLLAFSSLFGEGAKLAIVATAGAITGALIPAVAALKLSLSAALLPLVPLAAKGAIIAAGIYLAVKAWREFGTEVKATLANIPTAFLALYNAGAAVVQKLAALAMGLVNELFSSLYYSTQRSTNFIIQSMSPAFADLTLWSAKKTAELQKQTQESINQLQIYGQLIDETYTLYRTQKALADFSDWSGVRTLEELYSRIERTVGRIRESSMAIGAPITSLLKGMMGMGPNATKPKLTTIGKTSTGKKDPLIEEARRTSEQIEQAWFGQTQSKEAQLDRQFRLELDALNKTKALNSNYQRDRWMLEETYYQRRVDLRRAENEEQARKLLEVSESEHRYFREQMDIEAQLAEAHFERIRAVQDGSALEAQLSEARRQGDLESYIRHLDEKNAADRAYLEGKRNLIETYDQLQRDATRSQASYMAEAYRTVYYGLTDALTGIVTGAKNAGEAFKQLGMQIIQMVVRWQIQRKLAAAMSKSIEAAQLVASTAAAAATAAAWAPAAAMVAAATFGASTAAAGAGLATLTTMSRALAIPGLAEGGIVSRPTLAMIGEGGEAEAVIPLSKLKDLVGIGAGSPGNVQINVINQTGQPMTARSSQRMDGGKTVVDLFLDGYSRNVSGIQDLIGRR